MGSEKLEEDEEALLRETRGDKMLDTAIYRDMYVRCCL
jgi:hypothetical protein